MLYKAKNTTSQTSFARIVLEGDIYYANAIFLGSGDSLSFSKPRAALLNKFMSAFARISSWWHKAILKLFFLMGSNTYLPHKV
jgi:hypothetical protein